LTPVSARQLVLHIKQLSTEQLSKLLQGDSRQPQRFRLTADGRPGWPGTVLTGLAASESFQLRSEFATLQQSKVDTQLQQWLVWNATHNVYQEVPKDS
jgi:hypothetical protein